MITIDKHKNGMIRNTGDIITKDLDYGFFITAHKCQGSTYSHAFIMANDIEENRNIREKNKILYVAMSRPEKTCTVLTSKLDY